MATAIQFLRSDTPSLRPNPVTLAAGMPMLNTNETDPGLFFKARDGSLLKVGPCSVSDNPPNSSAQGFEGNSLGEMWLDTSGTDAPRLRVWTGTEWSAGAGVTIDEDQTITGQKTFTQTIFASAGINAVGQEIFAGALTLSGTAESALTTSGMEPTTLTTKSYVDSKTSSATLAFSLTPGAYIDGEAFDGSEAQDWNILASSANNANQLVARDSGGNFVANTATLNGTLQLVDRPVSIGDGTTGMLESVGGVLRYYDGTDWVGLNGDASVTSLTCSGNAEFAALVNARDYVAQQTDDTFPVYRGLAVGGSTTSRINGDGSATFDGAVTAANITAFKTNLAASAASATTIAALRTAIIDALNNDL